MPRTDSPARAPSRVLHYLALVFFVYGRCPFQPNGTDSPASCIYRGPLSLAVGIGNPMQAIPNHPPLPGMVVPQAMPKSRWNASAFPVSVRGKDRSSSNSFARTIAPGGGGSRQSLSSPLLPWFEDPSLEAHTVALKRAAALFVQID